MAIAPQSLKRKLVRLLLYAVGAVPLFLAYRGFLAPRIDPLVMKDNISSTMPEVSLVPQPIVDLSPSKASGTTLTFYGNTFEAPWREIGRRINGDFAVVTFAPRIGIMIWSSMSRTAPLRVARLNSTTRMAGISYDEESATLNMTPTQIRFLDPPQVSATRVSLLVRKALSGPGLKSGIYRFRTATIRGFQIGNPAESSQVRLDMFNSAGNFLGEILCVFGKDSSARGAQADLNRIIQTFHPIADNSASSVSSSQSVSHKAPR
jgi:hypothetical protein